MAGYNGSGTFVRSFSWASDASNGINISASRMDTEDNGFATGLSNCLTRDGQSPALANIPMGGFKITGIGNGTSANDAAAFGQIFPITGGTLTGKLNTIASAVGAAGFSLPHGTAPTSPTNGDIWTTTSGLYARINGNTVGPYSAAGSLATTSQILANSAGLILSTDQTWAAAAEVTLTDAATISVDMSTFINGVVTLGGNRTLGAPSNTKNGQSGYIAIVQDGTGSRTLSYASGWKFAGGTAPTLTTTAGAVDMLFYQVRSSSVIYATLVKDVK